MNNIKEMAANAGNGMIVGLITGLITGAIIGLLFVYALHKEYIKKNNAYKKKMCRLYYLMVNWKKTDIMGKRIEFFLAENNYRSVAIYGMREVGELLYRELKKSDVTIKYLIDKDAGYFYADADMPLVGIDQRFEDVDIIIVTAITYYNEIYESLIDKTDAKIMSLSDIINSMLNRSNE